MADQDVTLRQCPNCRHWLPRADFGRGNKHTPCRACRGKLHRERKARIFEQICRRIGEPNAIGMGELYEIAFGAEWSNRQNDTRRLRDLVQEMRDEGVPICASNSATGGGYYLPATAEELNNYCRGVERIGLLYLARSAAMRKKPLDALLGQLALELGKESESESS